MTFKPPPSAPQEPPRLSFTYSSMITAVQTAQEDLPITGFNSDGFPVYPAKQNGHWFSKYDFSVKHIKGSQNLIPDLLSIAKDFVPYTTPRTQNTPEIGLTLLVHTDNLLR